MGRYRRVSNEDADLPAKREARIAVAMRRRLRRRRARQALSGVPSPQRQGRRGLARAF
jgi:hypothetical protein